MEHLQPETLVLRAMGEQAGPPDADEHLISCETCRREYEDLRDGARIAKDVTEDERDLPSPPPGLWDRIEAELGDELHATADPPARSGASSPPGASAAAGVASLDERRSRRRAATWGVLGAAAAVVAAAVIAVSTVIGPGSPAESVGVAALEPLDDRADTAAEARLVEEDGELVLRIDEASLPDPDGYYELWLIDTDVVGMVSLGPLDADRGNRIPEGLDPESYPVVDVSLEPLDGDPTHSGDSLLRGVLDLEV